MFEQARRIATWTAFAAVVALGLAGPANADPLADQFADHQGELIIEKVRLMTATEGGWSTLRLRITNESRDPAHLLGVETKLAPDARIVGRIDDHQTTTLESIGVRADSVLDLTSDHLWIELGPLNLAVKPGETIPLVLVFARGRVRVQARVQGIDG